MPTPQKEVTELIREIKATGYKVASSGRTHHVVLDKQGRRVVDENGPLIISKTPSEHRWREMTVHRLIKAGVFKEDPRKEKQKPKSQEEHRKDSAKRLGSPEMQRLKVEAVKARAREQASLTQAVRSRFEPIVVKLGGWHEGHGRHGAPGVQVSELGRVMMFWLTGEQLPSFSTLAAAQQVAGNLKRGGTISDKNRAILEPFVVELEQKGDDARDFYFEVVRAVKGLPPSQRHERDRPLQLVSGNGATGEPAGDETEPEESVAAPAPPSVAVLSAGVPMLAMEAVYLMARAGDNDMATVLTIGEKLARLEMGGEG